MMRSVFVCSLASISSFLVAPALAQQTIQVPGQAATIEAAIAMAADGDRIVLLNPVYQIPAAGLVLNKSLIIEPVAGNRATIDYPDQTYGPQPALRITGLGSQGRVVLRNLTFEGGFATGLSYGARAAALQVQLSTATGELVLQGVHAIGETRYVHGSCPGLRIDAGPGVDVLVRDCRFEGAPGWGPFPLGGGDLEYDGSWGAAGWVAGVLLAECSQFVGGRGGRSVWDSWGPFPPSPNGGAALAIVFSGMRAALKNCEIIEGARGPVWAPAVIPPGMPDPCTRHGSSGVSSFNQVELYDCTRTFVPSVGCNMTPQTQSLQAGRNDVECVAPAVIGQPFSFGVRTVAAGAGFTLLIGGFQVDAVSVPGIAEPLRIENPFALGVLTPSALPAWTTVSMPAPPASLLGLLPTYAVQPLHLDATGFRFGSFATFTVRS